MNKQIEVDENDLKKLAIELCALGESRGDEPDVFAVKLSMIAKHMCETHGIEIRSERKMDA